jgi:salicylate hydroxylase
LTQFRKDAYIFANLLNRLLCQGSKDIQRITDIYTVIRRPTANSFAVGSREQGIRYEFNASGFEDIEEGDPIAAERLNDLGRSIEKGWDLPWNYNELGLRFWYLKWVAARTIFRI